MKTGNFQGNVKVLKISFIDGTLVYFYSSTQSNNK